MDAVLPVCLWEDNLYGPLGLGDMLQFYAGPFVDLLNRLAVLSEILKLDPGRWAFKRDSLDWCKESIEALLVGVERMGLASSIAQTRRVLALWDSGPPPAGALPQDVRDNIEDLTRRIRDDLNERIFYCVLPDKAPFIVRNPPSQSSSLGSLRLRTAAEYFGDRVAKRFQPIEADLYSACQCLVYECGGACLFHLLRATEIAVPRIAKLCDIKDPKPSWGSVLDKAEKYTQRTEYKDLPDLIKPHVDFLRDIVADMRSMQRAWRNKIIHVEDRLIVGAGEVTVQAASEMLTATSVFLRRLSEGLPDWC